MPGSTTLLGCVHRSVGVPDEPVGVRGVVVQREPDGGREKKLAPVQDEGLSEHGFDLPGNGHRLCLRRVVDEECELVAAETGDDVPLVRRRPNLSAIWTRIRSPTGWPRLSLIHLKRSRSKNITATLEPGSPRRCVSCSRNQVRFGSPVSGSTLAAAVSASSLRLRPRSTRSRGYRTAPG